MHCTYVFIRHIWLKSRLCVFMSIHGHRHAHLFLSVVFFLVSLYLVLKSFFHLFLNPAMVPDENSMEDPLCNSSFGSMVSLDYVTPDTGRVVKYVEKLSSQSHNKWKKEKPEIQVQISKLDGVSWEFTYIEIMLLQGRSSMCRRDDFPIPVNYIEFQRETKTSLDALQEATIDDYWNMMAITHCLNLRSV